MAAFIHGEIADLMDVIEHAADMLWNSHHPLIAGLGTDIAGARVAIRLAARLRGVIDHSASDMLLKGIRTLQDVGAMFTTPVEAYRRADVLLAIGPGAFQASRIDDAALLSIGGLESLRELIWLCPGDGVSEIGMTQVALRIGEDPRELTSLIGLMRARIKGRRSATTAYDSDLETAVARLKGARYGIAIFDPADLDSLAIENVNGLVRALNATTRFTTLRRPGPDNVNGVNEVTTWLTGHPVRLGFGRGFPEYDPWRFDANRLVASGEVDMALWISTIHPTFPSWSGKIPMVALVGPGSGQIGSDVTIEVGIPAIDHDAVLFSGRTGALTAVRAAEGSDRPTVAYVLQEIEVQLAGTCL